MKPRRFISQFVSELYAILIGIGIANVIFTLRIDFTHWFEVAMAVFVTVVVSLYWWDWAEYVEDHFVASATEFAIDFAALIVLEFLFVHFRDPLRLSWNFLALGVVDLIWVVNHLHQSPEQTYSLGRFWLGQKVLGVALYGGGLALVLSLHGTVGIEPLGASVVLTAVLVRFFCFRQVRRGDGWTFRVARPEDAPGIAAINGEYVSAGRTDAFLLEPLPEETVRALLAEGPQPRLFVAVRGGALLGYAKVSYAVGEAILSDLSWLDPFLEQGVRTGSVLHIEQVGVDPAHAGQGVGGALYRWLVETHPTRIPCAFVALRPRSNAGSLRFHAALGFEKAAVFRRTEFLGQEGYESVLLVLAARVPGGDEKRFGRG